MSDLFFDADRMAGTYPPKLWGWQSDAYQRDYVTRQLAQVAVAELPPWVVNEAQRLAIPLPVAA